MKRKQFLFYLYILVLFLPCLELALRIVGYRPYVRSEYSIRSNPSLCIVSDAQLGFALNPGIFNVTINEQLNYQVTHEKDSLRMTSYDRMSDSLPEAFIMGCSYTYGMGVDDSVNYPFYMQKNLPQLRIRNFGVPGYGNVQSLMQLERQLAKGNIPKFVVLGYAGFHNERNALTPNYRKHLHIGFERANEQLRDQMIASNIPYVKDDISSFTIYHESWTNLYADWKGRSWFATVNLFQDFKDGIDERKAQPEGATFAILAKMKQVCEANDISFIIAGLTPDEHTLSGIQFLKAQGFHAFDVSVNLRSPTYSNLPFDSHPNAKAHRLYASRILQHISDL